ncbi:MAG: hypothetical protein F4106_06015 [Gemmatimonadetes bacterium]|nr:hypothetical protein [Gemmatimonadota bacterium]MXX71777.1 hypothetical protein [Gemmatimonadota bacterium]MYC91756.1 hypothetical protein [Gemmatimonadota bacterium]MYG36111.1 hypothetical protein [Gemmatimonadota bacterium]MYJ17588.1 hypothetical protein [Gemmatimonadota bacterium]
MTARDTRQDLRFQADETPTYPVSFGLAFQYVLLNIAGIVITVAIVVRAGGGSETYLTWAAFAVLIVCGISTLIQAKRIGGRIGAGYILLMGTSGVFIAVSVAALERSGPALLATLIVASSLFQFLIASRLSLLRRVITPTVAGTVIMLIAVTVMPIGFDLLFLAPDGADPAAAPLTALATIVITIVIVLRARGALRLWGSVIGALGGCLVAAGYGIYDMGIVAEAQWFGVPAAGWPGFDLSLSPAFWAMLPAFIFVTLVGAIETIGDGMAIQRVSWRKRRATDFRAVQGAVAADGVGNLLSGLLATVPNTTYSNSVSIVEITGVAARRVGVCIGLIFIALAFFPKATAVLLAIPNPVVGAYIIVLIAILFVLGLEMVTQDGIDYRKATIIGVSFWIGAGFQSGQIPSEYFSWAGQLLENGMTSGGLTAILLSAFMELSGPRRRRIETTLNVEAQPKIQAFMETFGARSGLGEDLVHRMSLAAEETLLVLLDEVTEDDTLGTRRLRVTARAEGGGAELEFLAAAGEGNIEDRMAFIGGTATEVPVEQDFSIRLLRHIATSVRHQKYHDTDIVTVRVDPVGAA